MIVYCDKCQHWYDDEYRLTYCPHKVFPANDDKNNFKWHYDSYYSKEKPEKPS